MGYPAALISCQIVLECDNCLGFGQADYNHCVWLVSGTKIGSRYPTESDGWALERNGPVLLGETCLSHGSAVKTLLTPSRLAEAIVGLGPWDKLLSLSYLQRLQELTLLSEWEKAIWTVESPKRPGSVTWYLS